MKNIIIALGLVISASALVGCEESLDTYAGENGIYFDTRYEESEMQNDTIDVHWGLKKSDVTSQKLTLIVKLFGNTSPVDRRFSIRVETDPGDEKAAEQGVDYVMPPLEYVMEAGKAETPIEIEVLRRPDLKDNARRFRINLVESDELKFHFTRAVGFVNADVTTETRPIDLQRVIRIDESFPMPVWWDHRGEPYFGTWSQTKASLICDVMEIDREDWIAKATLTAGYLKFCGAFMKRWLDEQNALNPDNPILDEDGEPMKMGIESDR